MTEMYFAESGLSRPELIIDGHIIDGLTLATILGLSHVYYDRSRTATSMRINLEAQTISFGIRNRKKDSFSPFHTMTFQEIAGVDVREICSKIKKARRSRSRP